jgi:hypothetical protein
LIIEDKAPEIEAILNKKVKKNNFNFTLGNRNSRSSVKSHDKGSFKEQDPLTVSAPATSTQVPKDLNKHI